MSVNDSDLEPPLEGNRFAALDYHDSDGAAAQGEVAPSAETVRQRRPASEVEIVEVPEPTVDSDPDSHSLDAVDLHEVFELRARVMRSVPVVLSGAFRAAIRVSMQEILNGVEAHSDVRAERGWKLFMLLPRMLLFRPARVVWFTARSWKVASDNSMKGIGLLS